MDPPPGFAARRWKAILWEVDAAVKSETGRYDAQIVFTFAQRSDGFAS
jgi:hypothetical protein